MCSVNPPDVSKLTLSEEETSADLVASNSNVGGSSLQLQQQPIPHKSARLPPPSAASKKLGFLKRMKTDMNFFNRISAPPPPNAAAEPSAAATARAPPAFNSPSTNNSADLIEAESAADSRKVSSSSSYAAAAAAAAPSAAQAPPTPSRAGAAGGGRTRPPKSTSASVVSNWHKLAHSASRAANRLSVPIGPRIFLSPPALSQTAPKAGSSSPSPLHTPVHVVRSEGSRLLLEQQQVLGGSSISILSDDGVPRTSGGGGNCSRFAAAQAPDWLDDVRAVLERHRPSKERVRGWSANFGALLADQCVLPLHYTTVVGF